MNAFLRKNLSRLFTNDACPRRLCCSVSLPLFATCNQGQLLAPSAMFDLLLQKHHFSSQVATKAASVLNQAKDPEFSDSILSFLKENGFSNTQLEKLAKHSPEVLSSSFEDDIKSKIRVLQDLGLDSIDIAEIASSNSWILFSKFDTLVDYLRVENDLFGTNDAVVKLFTGPGCRWFTQDALRQRLVPNIEFLKSCGMPTKRIQTLFYNYPRCLVVKPEYIRISVEKAERLGVRRHSDMFIYALRAVSALTEEAWELKLQAFRSFGFSETDIQKMFQTGPIVFVGSVERLKRAKDVILATGKYGIPCIVNSPVALNCSIEKRLQPRFQILTILERESLIKENWLALGTVCKMTNQKFFEKFVGPYTNKVGQVYDIAKSSFESQQKHNTVNKKH